MTENGTETSEVGGTDGAAQALRVLIVYFTYTQQSRKVAETMAEGLRAKGCAVDLAPIEFTDKRWAERFTRSRSSAPYPRCGRHVAGADAQRHGRDRRAGGGA